MVRHADAGAVADQDPALRSMLGRFVKENAVGNYGIYYGDEHSGAIKQFAG